MSRDHVTEEGVDHAGPGTEEVHIGDCEQKRRREICQRRGELDERSGGDVRSRHRPGERDADRYAQKRGPTAEDQRIEQRLGIDPGREDMREIPERRPLVGRYAPPQQREQRQDDQDDQRNERSRLDPKFELKPHV
jgi:hypothetical protein